MDTKYLNWYVDKFLRASREKETQLRALLADQTRCANLAQRIRGDLSNLITTATLELGFVFSNGTDEETAYVMEQLRVRVTEP
jgi:hypothetical protein